MSVSAELKLQRKWVLGSALTILAGISLLAFFLLRSTAAPPPAVQGSLLLEPRPLPDFNLVTHHQEALTRKDLQGRWHLLTYGFTHCPDICPTTMMELAAFQRALEGQTEYRDLDVWFYSIDPGRDTLAHLADYVPWFHPEFRGLLAVDEAEARRFEQGLGIVAFVEPSQDPSQYQVAHGLQIYLMNDQGQLEAALHPTRERNGLQHYEVDRLLQDYLAIRHWRDQT